MKLKGGSKQKFIRENRDFILKYAALFGQVDCLKKFQLDPTTMQSMTDRTYQVIEPVTELERCKVMAEIATQSCRDLRREVQDLKKQFQDFQDSVAEQLVSRFFKPLLQSRLQLPRSLEKLSASSLSMDDLSDIGPEVKECPDPFLSQAKALYSRRPDLTVGVFVKQFRVGRIRASSLLEAVKNQE